MRQRICPSEGDSDFVTLDPMEPRGTIILDAQARQRLLVLANVLASELVRQDPQPLLSWSSLRQRHFTRSEHGTPIRRSAAYQWTR